ncbi:UDP-N-acetylmuramate--L-alanine ligase, partial [Candidatus Saccharibacteria bacterium]|nr:UDP-N-acetylmuramate--L-alanine ligase [Candidatus Saccharibacteria bacterium]
MKVYISGISGTGMGPLALMAKNAGMTVVGSDRQAGPIVDELKKAGIEFEIGEQNGDYLQKQDNIDWFVYTSALPEDHPELVFAKNHNIKVSKRDEFIAYLVKELGLKMGAVAGTHGKTTTTSMLIWAAKKLGIKASYLVGTTL